MALKLLRRGAILFAISLLANYAILTQPFVTALPTPPAQVDETMLRVHVNELTKTFYPRSFDRRTTLQGAAAYIHTQFSLFSDSVEDQVFSVDGHEYRNIIARFGAMNGPFLVIGAHYDAYGDAVRGRNFPAGYDVTTNTPGADDNASGVAGLLELARLLASAGPKIGVELVAFTLEEPPNFRQDSMGSARHARLLKVAGRKIEAMISLEMIGYFSDRPNSQTYPIPGLDFIYPNRGDFIGIVGRVQDWAVTRKVKAAMAGASDLPVVSINALSLVPGLDFSDHRSYWAAGFPAVMITDTAFFRNPNYHKASDTADTLDYTRMAKVVAGVFGVTQHYSK